MKSLLVLAAAWFLATAVASEAQQRPYRGDIGMSVLLCKYSDAPTPARSRNFFERMIVNSGTGGHADYWSDVSGGSLRTGDTAVRGWYTLDQTEAEARAYGGGGSPNRTRKFTDCVNKARDEGYTVPQDHITIVVTSPGIDTFGMGGGAFVGENTNVGTVAHEVGHAITLNHSFVDNSSYCNATWASVGEYGDRRDLMSFGNVFGFPHAEFGTIPPGLNAYHLDRMGWMERGSILRFGADGRFDRTVTLSTLSRGNSGPGTRMIRIPFDPSDPYRYYTVEYRTVERSDQGIPVDTVLIHEVDDRQTTKCNDPTNVSNTGYRSYLKVNAANTAVLENLNENGVRIDTISKDPTAGTARVRIRSTRPEFCRQGLVWREARSSDRVCVTPGRRSDVREENRLAPSRREPAGGAFGPDTCRQGFVWREAFPDDHVCVRPASRGKTRAENQRAWENRLGGAVYGPNTCKSGFVWREADQRDWVCVRPHIRAIVRDENARAASRRRSGSNRCLQGFVWREAFPGDLVCVTPARRSDTRRENEQANDNLANKGA